MTVAIYTFIDYTIILLIEKAVNELLYVARLLQQASTIVF